jgi:hypothetical protein
LGNGDTRAYRHLSTGPPYCHVGHVSLALPSLLYPSFLTLVASDESNSDDFDTFRFAHSNAGLFLPQRLRRDKRQLDSRGERVQCASKEFHERVSTPERKATGVTWQRHSGYMSLSCRRDRLSGTKLRPGLQANQVNA